MLKKLVAAVCTTLAIPVHSAETDNYLAWDKTLKNSAHVINSYMQEQVDNVLADVNKRPHLHQCHDIPTRLGLFFSATYQRNTKDWAEANPAIDVYPARNVSYDDYFKMSIYRDLKSFHLARILNVNGVHIGTDKIAHSISMGFTYYALHGKSMQRRLVNSINPAETYERGLSDAIEFGISSERTLLGAWTTKVFSFADLEANFQGFLFFLDFCKQEDPLVIKQNGKWTLTRKVDFTKHVSPYWDETFAPSHFNAEAWDKIKNRISDYCAVPSNNSIVAAKRESYKAFADKKSFNIQYLEKLAAKGEIPGRHEHSFDNICAALQK